MGNSLSKKKFVVGSLKSATLGAAPKPPKPQKLFDYYTGFWSLDSNEASVAEYISKFANVESINELKTKGGYYKSFHFTVNSVYMEKILDPDNWPDGIRIKRYFEAKVSGTTRGGYGNSRGGANTTRGGLTSTFVGNRTQENRLNKRSRSEDTCYSDDEFDDLMNKKQPLTIQSNSQQESNITSDIRAENSMEHENI